MADEAVQQNEESATTTSETSVANPRRVRWQRRD